MFTFLTQIFGTSFDREIKKLRPLVGRISDLEKTISSLSDLELKAKTPFFKEQLEKGQNLDNILPEVFAVCREAAKRTLNMRHYDVQIIGGLVLHHGQIAEMKTGEGKTLAATLPIYLNALSGRGVHIVTVNDYLAGRDREWMEPLYHFLGLSAGAIAQDMDETGRKQAYGADITYGTNNEFGFDYLRDNMKYSSSHCVQRELNYAIVDECDSILIDEARTPLIISGPKNRSTEKYHQVKHIIPHLKKEDHFTMEEKSKTVSLTEEGNAKIESLLGVNNLYDIKHIEYLHNIHQSLKAHYLYKKNVDYMVQGDEVVIVDEFTGRLMPGRRWSEGLHQAVEVKEGLKVKTENQTLSTITFQNYFRMYNKLAGMTGTAETEAEEFKKIYKLKVQVIPTNKPVVRKDYNDEVYKTEAVKYKYIGEFIKELNQKGQPVLVGTVSIEKSERLSQILKQSRIPHKVLNAKYHDKEAEIVAQAGRHKAITIATNMAGRGTDIVLGGKPEFLCGPKKSQESDGEYQTRLKTFQDLCQKEKEEVISAGGLFIIGTERHEARRIDNQLRGRSGRQGDPGASKFYLSLEDDLMRVFGGDRMKKIMTTLKMDESAPITDKILTRAIANAQKKVEGHNFEIRKHLLEYDNVMNQQRSSIYKMRRDVITAKNMERLFLDHLTDVLSYWLDKTAGENMKKEEWDLPSLYGFLRRSFNVELNPAGALRENLNPDSLSDLAQKAVKARFEEKKEEFGEHLNPLIRFLLLQTVDIRWREHLENVDHLREGIHLRSFAQKDPLVEYKKESFHLFESLHLIISTEIVEKFFKIQISSSDELSANQEEDNRLIYNEKPQAKAFAAHQEMAQRAGNKQRTAPNRKQRRAQTAGFKKTKIKI